MTLTDIVVLIVIVLTVGGAIAYIVRAKRRGQKCVGCPYAKECGGCCPSQKDSETK